MGSFDLDVVLDAQPVRSYCTAKHSAEGCLPAIGWSGMPDVAGPKDFLITCSNVMPNLYGDIVSDLGAGLIGGLGMAPGANIGADMAVFEPTHGSAPKYKGLDKMNPFAMMLSGVMMLRHLGEQDAAMRLEAAIASVIEEGKDVTYDMKPNRDDPTAVGTREMATAICEKLAR